MTEYDVLFWLLVLVLGAIAVSIETGVATRHRRLILTSMGSVLLSTLYIMFVVDDMSSFNFGPKPGKLGGGGGGSEPGSFGFDNKKGGGGGSGGSGSAAGKAKIVTYRTGIFQDCEHCPSMVVVPNGKLMAGSPKSEARRQANEGPQKPIAFAKSFAVGRSEITREEFGAFINATKYQPARVCQVNGRRISADWNSPGYPQGPKHPVVCVAWQDAKAYVAWLKSSTGRGYRLMSESEWEYTARAKTTTPYWTGERIDETRANFGNTNKGTVPTAESSANPFGLFDVHGNVWELTEDCYAPDPTYLPADGRPVNMMGDCGQRVVKGGAWDSRADQLRVAYRSTAGEQAASNTLGFRVARDLDDQDIAR